MHRRPFLVQLAARVASAAGVAGFASGCTEITSATFDAPSLLPPLGADAVRAIGSAYLKSPGAERDAKSLRASIARAMGRKPFAALVVEDFRDERTVWVEGWLLSINEARRYGLFALTGV